MSSVDPIPEKVQKWLRTAPHFCDTCDYMSAGSFCEKFKSRPPHDFKFTENACDDWEPKVNDIPF